MADIKKAAEWMAIGKKVRRAIEAEFDLFTYRKDLFGCLNHVGRSDFQGAIIAVNDLLADDWEVVE